MGKYELRDYQKLAVSKALGTEDKELVLELSQRSGKSLVMADLADKLNKQGKTVIVATEITILIEQLYKHIKMYGLEPHVIKAGMHQEGNCNIYLVMEQSFHSDKRVDFEHLKNCIYIRDEFNRAISGKRYKEIISFLKPEKIIGFSATPFTATGMFLKPNLIPYSIFPTTKAIQAGYVVPLKWFIPIFMKNIEYEKVKMSGNDYSTNSLAEIQDTSNFYEGIKTLFTKIELDKNHTIIFCNNIEQTEKIFEIVNKIEPAVLVHSKRTKEENEQAINAFKSGYKKVIVNTLILTVGFDAPIANQIVNLRRTKSFTLVRQAMFRASNAIEGKEYATIYDIGGLVEEHGFFDREDYVPQSSKEEVKKILKESKVENLNNIIEFKDEEILEVSKEKIEIIIKEIEDYKLEAMKRRSINDLLIAYNASSKIDDVLTLGSMIYDEIYRTRTKQSTIDWIREAYNEAVGSYPMKEGYFFKATKTRLKNIIKQEKKIASLKYFQEWCVKNIEEQEPWLKNSNKDDGRGIISF